MTRPLDITGIGLRRIDLPPLERGRFDPKTFFPEPHRRLEIEIGSGKGTFLVQQAALQPQVNFLGFEWEGEFFRYAADRARRHALANVRIVHEDATEFIRHRCIDKAAAVIHLYFSDPWPKKRHHKRRVIQDHTLREFHRVLEPGGELRLVTDHDELWSWCVRHFERHADLFEMQPFASAGAAASAGEIVGTNFERKYRREGRPFHAVACVRI